MKLLSDKAKKPICSSCGAPIDEHCAYMAVGPFGIVHLKEPCLVVVVNKIRNAEKDWSWDKKPSIKTEGIANVQDEGQGHREIQAEES